ncbi:MAG: divalent-cation tolerance protein CutA, partial [Alphaproteobacteria bacterium]|nr:divalent-cation tolerance protein CutA [Alphaproteobacteria bacterium]
MTNLLLIRITCPSQRVANKIAETAVEQRLAACGNVDGPVMATYRWKGVIEQAWEFVLWLKAPEA